MNGNKLNISVSKIQNFFDYGLSTVGNWSLSFDIIDLCLCLIINNSCTH